MKDYNKLLTHVKYNIKSESLYGWIDNIDDSLPAIQIIINIFIGNKNIIGYNICNNELFILLEFNEIIRIIN